MSDSTRLGSGRIRAGLGWPRLGWPRLGWRPRLVGQLAIAVLALAVASCGLVTGGDDDAGGPDPSDPAFDAEAPDAVPEEAGEIIPVEVAVRLEEVGSATQPTAVLARPGWPHLLIVEAPGRLRQLSVNHRMNRDGTIASTSYRVERGNQLDISRQVLEPPEGGLRGAAFSSDGRSLYLAYISTDPALVVDRYQMGDNVDTSSRRTVLRVESETGIRTGGALAFGPDGFLYVGVGNEATSLPSAQDPNSLLGKVLRLDPDGSLDDAPYAIPPGNPFVGGVGLPEIWASGVFDPRGIAFDPATRDLFVTDWRGNVDLTLHLAAGSGQAGRGANLGFPEAAATAGTLVNAPRPPHCDLAGAGVYRGTAIAELAGAYVFGDRCTSVVGGTIMLGGFVAGRRIVAAGLEPETFAGVGIDGDGELWLLTTGGGVHRVLPA